MSYRIAQDDDYLGNRRWHWRTWIEADDDELDRVVQVTWYLHHSFRDPVVVSRDRDSRFRLERTGWGMFLIRAELEIGADVPLELQHWLTLVTDEGALAPVRVALGRTGGAARPEQRVFLSYGAEDRELAGRVKQTLAARGYEILDPGDTEPGTPWQPAVERMLRESDVVLGLVTSDFASPFVIGELNSAVQSRKPAIAVMGRDVERPLGLDQGLARINLDLTAPAADEEVFHVMEKIAPEREA